MRGAKVLDAYSVIAYLEKEPSAERVAECIKEARDAGRHLLLCTINWGEVYYIAVREAGKQGAEKALEVIETLPIKLVDPDLELTKQAALYKATHKMSYADCFAAALAKTRKGTLITGDKEFKSIENEIKIAWLE